MSLKERIKELAQSKKLTQKLFGKKLDIKQPQLSRYERGISEPDYETIKKYYDFYNVNLNWLFSGKGDMFNKTNQENPEPGGEVKPPIIKTPNEENPKLINIISDELETLK